MCLYWHYKYGQTLQYDNTFWRVESRPTISCIPNALLCEVPITKQIIIHEYLFSPQFSRETVIENYVSFIENFPRAEKVLDELMNKSTFQRFIEVGAVFSV